MKIFSGETNYKIVTPDDLEDYNHQLTIDYSLIAVCLATAILFAYIIYRVAKTIKCSDNVFLTMLVFLLACLAAQIAYFSFRIPIMNRAILGEDLTYNHEYYCQATVLGTMPCAFLALGTLLNINKWCYYNLRTRALKGDKQQIELTKNTLKRKVSILNYITGILAITIIAPYCYFGAAACNS